MADDRIATIKESLMKLRVHPDQVMELRALSVPAKYGRPKVVAGWYDDINAMARDAAKLDDMKPDGVYLVLNVIHEALLCRGYNRLVEHPKATASDADIVRRVWLPVDFDPVRPAYTSATPEEIETAKLRALDAADWLTGELGDEAAAWAFSGNGWHLLFRIDLPNTDKSTTFVQSVINATADKFSDEAVSVDRTVFNASRIWKLYGTMARKGDSVPKLNRVHRRARILTKGFVDDHIG